MREEIVDLIKLSKQPNSNILLLLEDAFERGFKKGIELAKAKAIEAILKEK